MPLLTRPTTVGVANARRTRATHRKQQARAARQRQIVCFGGPSLSPGSAALNRYVLSLVTQRPRICLLVSSRDGELDEHVGRFYRQFSDALCRPSHLFPPRRRDEGRDLRSELLRQDVIYVGGGSLIRVLGGWRLHEIDIALRKAWRNGTLLCGFDAGALCWFAEAVTSFDGQIRASRGLGLLPWSGCVHYRYGRARRVAYRSRVLGGMRPGFAVEESVALRFVGTRLSAAVSSRPDGRAFRVEAQEGRLVETPIPVTHLQSKADATVADG